MHTHYWCVICHYSDLFKVQQENQAHLHFHLQITWLMRVISGIFMQEGAPQVDLTPRRHYRYMTPTCTEIIDETYVPHVGGRL